MYAMKDPHFEKLERMYLSAAINTDLYDSTQIEISQNKAVISLDISDKYFHALGALHGSVYFKLLDDASFFAVNSAVRDVFVLTASYHVHFLRPVMGGSITAIGELSEVSGKYFLANADLYDEKDRKVGFGSGRFVRSKIELNEEIGYK